MHANWSSQNPLFFRPSIFRQPVPLFKVNAAESLFNPNTPLLFGGIGKLTGTYRNAPGKCMLWSDLFGGVNL